MVETLFGRGVATVVGGDEEIAAIAVADPSESRELGR